MVGIMKKNLITVCIIFLFIGIAINPLTISQKISENQLDQQEEINEITPTIFDKYITLLMKIGHKPSISACIIKKDTVVWSNSYGYYDLENELPATKDTLYLQASVSKTITATALMQLYDKGLFELDDDINKYLPFEFRNPNHPDIPITIEMLLSHRSSLADDNLYWLCLSYLPGDPDCEEWPMPWFENYFTPDGSAFSSSTWSKDKPGEKYYYANAGFSLIGYLVEILSGQDFNEYCKEHIFQPLEMYNSSFRLRDHDINSIAVPYEYKNGNYFRHPQYGIHLIYPAITLRTSTEEYSHFLIAHMNGGVWNGSRILNESTVELMHTAHFSPEDTYNYGLGWQLKIDKRGKKEISHSGGYVGAHDLIRYKPDKDTAVIIFSNEMDSELMSSKIEMYAFRFINKAIWFKAEYQL